MQVKFQIITVIGVLIFVVFCFGCISENNSYDQENITNISSAIKEIKPQILEYYNTQPETSNITIKGRPQIIDDKILNGTSDLSGYRDDYVYLNDERTFFIFIKNTNKNIGTKRYINGGQNIDVTFYQPIIDIVVVYWPEKKIVGWHRIYGNSTIPDSIESNHAPLGGNSKETRILDIDAYGWIHSLPGWNPPTNSDPDNPYFLNQ